ncbi:MAG: 3-oxoacyl-ACP synthase, partial [Flavipsychrobacter sp.]|nr:3-oxoacyl-ACP synthase [Flavipsychrobacter sp.]
GREVMQQEIDLNMTRLNEVNKMKLAFERITHDHKSDSAQPGSLVHTGNGNYYIAISAGQLKIEGTTYYAISAASPVGLALAGRKAGDDTTLNGKNISIKEVS